MIARKGPGQAKLARAIRSNKWDWFVSAVTIFWTVGFIYEFVFNGFELLRLTLIGSTTVFVADLIVQYLRSSSWSAFLRNNWFTIVTLLPWVRIVRLLRVLRFGKAARILNHLPRLLDITSVSKELLSRTGRIFG